MKRYPAYKDSEVEWIGDIPIDWNTAKLKALCEKITDGSHFSPEIQEIGYPYVTVRDIRKGKIDFENCKKISENDYLTLSKNGCKPKENDILLTKDGTIGKAVVVTKNNDFVILSSLGLITPDLSKLVPKFLQYYLISSKNIDQMFSFIHGAALTRLTIKKIKELTTVFPPLDQQKYLIDYLNHKTHLIGTLIEKKQKQIELLQEQRAAIINQAVTKGLNPNVKMKDSSIEWLGEVPEHWGKKKIGYLLVMMGGSTPNKSEPAYWEGTTPWISPKDMKSFQIGTKAKDFISKKALEETSLQIIPRSTVLIVVRGMILAHTFPVGLTTLPLTINQDMKALTPSNECKSLYLARLLQGISPYILSLVEPSAHGTMCLRTDNFRNLYIYLPKLSEQDEIVEYIERTEATIDESITKLVKIIRLLREYRTTLISEVVTGKIDVRDEAIP